MSVSSVSLSTLSSATSSDVEMEESLVPSQRIPRHRAFSRYQSLSNITLDSGVSVQDIRNLTSSYQKLLDQATKEITRLNLEKNELEKEKEKLLESNVEMAEETKDLILDKKHWEQLKQEILKSNEELAEEVDKLYKSEDKMLLERDKLIQELKLLKATNQNLKDNNINLREEFEKEVKERRSVVEEIEQLKLENELMTRSQKKTSDKLHVVEKEMEELRKKLKQEREKVVDETAWKNQIIWKNQKLSQENERLLSRCEHLESLANQEIGDITDILETIQIIQEK